MAESSAERSSRAVVRLATEELSTGPWVYARHVAPAAGVEDGALVEVRDPSERFLGHALYNSASDIRLRWLARGRKTDLDRPREFLLRALKSADALRRRVLRLPEVTDVYRVVHAEGDDLPGLIVDRMNDILCCEHHALGFFRLRGDVAWALQQLYPGAKVVHRVPQGAIEAESFAQSDLEELAPVEDETLIEEHGLRYRVRPGAGHKTGWFCDQRDNRLALAKLAAGRDVLDLCCNAGGFALQAARHGARSVRGVDIDEVVLARAVDAAQLNGVAVDFIHADAFPYLRRLAGDAIKPNLVIVDPHKLIGSRSGFDAGMTKYLDLNALALGAARPGALVATFSCSGLLQDNQFVGMLFQAARRAGREIRYLGALGAGPDHPQRPDFSRSRYLKGALLALDGA
jgi:23S rRNA (cytosine1962-C5)-methyltransferase